MTIGGWIFMLVSWGAILWMFAFCLNKTLRNPKKGPESSSQAPEQQAGAVKKPSNPRI